MPLTDGFVSIGLVVRVLLVHAVVGEVHELVRQVLHGTRVPGERQSGRSYSMI